MSLGYFGSHVSSACYPTVLEKKYIYIYIRGLPTFIFLWAGVKAWSSIREFRRSTLMAARVTGELTKGLQQFCIQDKTLRSFQDQFRSTPSSSACWSSNTQRQPWLWPPTCEGCGTYSPRQQVFTLVLVGRFALCTVTLQAQDEEQVFSMTACWCFHYQHQLQIIFSMSITTLRYGPKTKNKKTMCLNYIHIWIIALKWVCSALQLWHWRLQSMNV